MERIEALTPEKKEQDKEESDDPMLNYRSFFSIKNHDDTDLISALTSSEIHIVTFPFSSDSYQVVGTNSGIIYVINSSTGTIVKKTQAHSKKITCLYIKEHSAIVSTSFDGILRVTSLCPEFDDMLIEM